MKAKEKCLEKNINLTESTKKAAKFRKRKKKLYVCVYILPAMQHSAEVQLAAAHVFALGLFINTCGAAQLMKPLHVGAGSGAQCLYLFTRYKKMGKLRKTNDKPKDANKQPIARQTDRIDAKHWGSYAIPRWEKRQRKKN